jgi:hypothetical protein
MPSFAKFEKLGFKVSVLIQHRSHLRTEWGFIVPLPMSMTSVAAPGDSGLS